MANDTHSDVNNALTQNTTLTAEIVAAYIGHNAVSAADLPKLLGEVYAALAALGSPPAPVAEALTPAVAIRKSVTPDHIVCLEDGQKFKSLKRHLNVKYGLTPEAYRQKWNLPADYPMVAPNYAARRSALAKNSGLGRKASPDVNAKRQKPRARAKSS